MTVISLDSIARISELSLEEIDLVDDADRGNVAVAGARCWRYSEGLVGGLISGVGRYFASNVIYDSTTQ